MLFLVAFAKVSSLISNKLFLIYYFSSFLGQALTCQSNLCQNGATCVNSNSIQIPTDLIGFTCVCPVGYYGTYCENSNKNRKIKAFKKLF